MGEYLESTFRILVSAAGATLAGPAGAVVGGMVGGLLGNALPGLAAFVETAASNLASDSVDRLGEQVLTRLSPSENEAVSDHLQAALSEALQEALYDLGGRECFPSAWKQDRPPVPEETCFPKTHTGRRIWRSSKPVAGQVKELFTNLHGQVESGEIIPSEPPSASRVTDARAFLEAENPSDLNRVFYTDLIEPALAPYRTLFAELPDLKTHLQNHLFDRMLVHFGRLVKEHSEAWRAFNQIVLTELRQSLQSVQGEQAEIGQRLDALLASPAGDGLSNWSAQVAELVSLAGGVDKKLDENFAALSARLNEQHAHVLDRLETALAISARIETKVDRVLRMLEGGRWQVEGTPPVALDEPPASGESPFKGLEYFDQDDSAIFFGREALTARLAARLRQDRFLAVVGASGSGKSSLVRAGLVPALQSGEPLSGGILPPAGSRKWPVFIFTPTARPLEMLAAQLSHRCPELGAASSLAQEMAHDHSALHRAAASILATNQASSRIFLVVDQLEELFTLCRSEEERQAFIDNLLFASTGEGSSSVVVVVTLRADFYDHCGHYEELRRALAEHQEYIGPMNAAELRRAIEEPAERGGWRLEPGLVDVILHDAGSEPGALPLLSHALLETWRHRRGRTLTLESYAESGGVRGAIARTAEAVYAGQFSPEQQQVARSIFLRLTEPGEGTQDTRRRATLSELPPAGDPLGRERVNAVLQALVDARLVTVGEGTVEVAHEALIREWPTLRRWLDDSRASLRIHRRLTEAALEWQRFARDESLLYRGLRLAEANEWAAAHPTEMNPLEMAYLQTSQAVIDREVGEREERRRHEMEKSMKLAEVLRQRIEEQALSTGRLRRRAYFLTAALAVAALLAVAAFLLARVSNHNAHVARDNAATAEAASTQAVAQQLTAEAARRVAQGQQATAQAEFVRAETASRHARAAALAALSLSSLEKAPQRAALLGVEALHLANLAGEPRVPLSEEAMWQALTTVGGQPLMSGKTAFHSVAYSPDGRLLAAGSERGQVYLFNRKDPASAPRILTNHSDRVTGLAFSQDLRWFASGSWDQTVQVYSLSNLDAVPVTLQAGHEGINDLAISPDGSWLAAAMWDGSLLVWSFDSLAGGPVVIPASTKILEAAAFSSNSRQLAAGGRDGKIRIWTAGEWEKPVLELDGDDKSVNALAFSPDGRWLASGGDDRVVRLFDLAAPTAAPRKLMHHQSWVISLTFTPNSKTLISGSGDQKIAVWSLDSINADPRELRGHENWVLALAVSPDGAELASSDWNGSLRAWNLAQPLTQPEVISGMGLGMAMSSSGRWLAASDRQSNIHLLDLANDTPRENAVMRGHQRAAATLVFSPDERRLASGSWDQTIRIWDVEHPAASPRVLTGHSNTVYTLDFSPDGRYLASGGWDQTVKIWDLDQRDNPPKTEKLDAEVMGVAYSPDGRWLAAGSSNGMLCIWDVSTGQLTAREPRIMETGIFSMRFSPDSRLLAVGATDGRLWIFHTEDWDSAPKVRYGHTDGVAVIAFSRDGRWLGTGSNDRSAFIWDLSTDGLEPVVLNGHENWVQGLAFSPDGELVITGGWDDRVLFWERRPELLEKAGCQIAGRNLTRAEWEQFFPTEVYRATCPQWPLEQ